MSHSSSPIFREEQPWRTSPPILVLTLIGAAAAWLLFVWVVVLGRGLGAGSVPPALAWGLWGLIGVAFPAAVLTLKQVVAVYPDHILVQTNPMTRYRLPLSEVVRVEPILKAALKNYTNQSVTMGQGSRTAYSIMGDQGVELERDDGSHVLLGSKQPEALAAAILRVWSPPAR